VLSGSYQVRAYTIRHDYDVHKFLEAYRLMLQRAIDEVWARIRWVEKSNTGRYRGKGWRRDAKRLIPILPKDGRFKHHELRDQLLADWDYARHYVDSAIKQAYAILRSWRRNYIRGERKRRKPRVRKRFVRVKETLYTVKDDVILVTLKPHGERLKFDIRRAWFRRRARGEMGELMLTEDKLVITFREKAGRLDPVGSIAWDSNEKSLDGFNPKLGWIKVDLVELFHIHRVYELKRRRLQSLASRKPSLRRILVKYSKRERDRARDFVHKLTTFMTSLFRGYVHGFEGLNKKRMFTKSRRRNRRIAKSNWRMIQDFMSYKSQVELLNPRNSSRRCSRCGGLNAPKGAQYTCKYCGLRIDRQLNACINLYLQMEGLTPSPKLFRELMKDWGGFTLTGSEVDERADELVRPAILVNFKRNIPMVINRYVSQNPCPARSIRPPHQIPPRKPTSFSCG